MVRICAVGLRALMVGIGFAAAVEATGQDTSKTAGAPPTRPHCQSKASTPETPGPDAQFDAALLARATGSAPILTGSPVVTYPRPAMDAGICGTVVVQVLVKADGRVGAARVVESLDKVNGLDADAIRTVTRWRFTPGRVNGTAVASVITARVEYVLDARPLSVREAANNVGRFVTVCGGLRRVVAAKPDAGARHFELSQDKKSILVRIPESMGDLSNKAEGSIGCVTGPIDNIDGRKQITVTQADRLDLVSEVADVPLTDIVGASDPGVVGPRILREVNPKYTQEAMHHKIAGVVEMEAVVLTDGRVGTVRVLRSLDKVYGLDDVAITTARLWRFAPGTKGGRPIPVRITIVMEFRIH